MMLKIIEFSFDMQSNYLHFNWTEHVAACILIDSHLCVPLSVHYNFTFPFHRMKTLILITIVLNIMLQSGMDISVIPCDRNLSFNWFRQRGVIKEMYISLVVHINIMNIQSNAFLNHQSKSELLGAIHSFFMNSATKHLVILKGVRTKLVQRKQHSQRWELITV